MITEFKINRRNWRTGGASNNARYGNTQLRNTKGMKCCLGFYCSASGIKSSSMTDIGLPSQIRVSSKERLVKKFPELLTKSHMENILSNKNITLDIAEVNDDSFLSDSQREKRIEELFKSIGIKVEFYGKYREEQY